MNQLVYSQGEEKDQITESTTKLAQNTKQKLKSNKKSEQKTQKNEKQEEQANINENIVKEDEEELVDPVKKMQSKTVSFGFQDVKVKEKQKMVNEVFHSVARGYDLVNDLASVGIQRLWKNIFINQIPAVFEKVKILDVAGGTGDIAIKLYEHFKYSGECKDVQVTCFDINSSMLAVGEEKALNRGIANIEFVEGNAEELPFKDNTFDFYTIAFGIRNVPRLSKALREAYRVLKPGGQFLCLEFSKVENPLLSQLYKWHTFNVIPFIGQIVINDSQSYKYLAESIEKWPNQEEFKKIIEDAGFQDCDYLNLTNGIVAIHNGYKIVLDQNVE